MSKKQILTDVYDTLMKNTQYEPQDFTKLKATKENEYSPSAWLDLDENIIYLGDYILKIEEVNNE